MEPCKNNNEISSFFNIKTNVFFFLLSVRSYTNSFLEIIDELKLKKFDKNNFDFEDFVVDLMSNYGIDLSLKNDFENCIYNKKLLELDDLISRLKLDPYELCAYFNWEKQNLEIL